MGYKSVDASFGATGRELFVSIKGIANSANRYISSLIAFREGFVPRRRGLLG
jgi:hypothetical protein